jgi:hypothetical protein
LGLCARPSVEPKRKFPGWTQSTNCKNYKGHVTAVREKGSYVCTAADGAQSIIAKNNLLSLFVPKPQVRKFPEFFMVDSVVTSEDNTLFKMRIPVFQVLLSWRDEAGITASSYC